MPTKKGDALEVGDRVRYDGHDLSDDGGPAPEDRGTVMILDPSLDAAEVVFDDSPRSWTVQQDSLTKIEDTDA